MADEEWNDELRDELLDTLRAYILGELRLAKRDEDEILEVVVDGLVDEIPEEEVPRFEAYAKQHFEEIREAYEAEKASWPRETDCDRLDDVQIELQEAGILFWQASPCCNTCSGSELPDRISEIEEDEPGFGERCRGYAFFHDQSLPDELLEDTRLSVYLSYGWFSDREGVSKDEYASEAVAIGNEVRSALESAGFEVDWNGQLSKKIRLSLNWQRRTPL